MDRIRNWLDNMGEAESGIFLILFGIAFSIFSYYLHNSWKKEGYKPFRPFRREGKTQSEDNFVIVMHTRTLLGIFMGIITCIFGIYKLLTSP